MDLQTATTTPPSQFASTALTWLRWRYSPIAELQATSDAESFVKQLAFPSVAHFLRPFFLFTDPVSLRGANEHPLQPTALHIRLLPQDRIREVDPTIRSSFFAKTLSETGEEELARYKKDIFPLLRRMSAQGANDDDLASGEVPLHHLLGADAAFSAEVRESVWKSNKVRDIMEQEGGSDVYSDGSSASASPATAAGGAAASAAATATALHAPRTSPGIGVARPNVAPSDMLHPPAPSSNQQGGNNSTSSSNSSNFPVAETLLRASYHTWFSTFIRDYHSAVRFTHFDPIDFPVAQVFCATSTYLNQPTHPECNLIASLQRLVEQSRVHAATQWPPWVNITLDRMNLVRIVFILHDPESDVSDKTVEAVQGRIQAEICGGSGGGCYVIRVAGHSKRNKDNNSSSFSINQNVLRPWANANSLHLLDDYAASVERLQRQLESDNLVTSQMSLEAAIAKVDATHPAVSGIASCTGGLVTRKDYEDVARAVNTALRLQLFPFIDRRLRAHAHFISENKQSALGKFASSLFSSNDKSKLPSVIKDRENPEPRYRAESLEMNMRRAGDLCMALQDYNGAINFYRLVRDEWKDTLAVREYNRPLLGAAKEAIAVCMFLLGKMSLPPNAADLKRDPEAARFEVAREDFRISKVQNYAFRVTQLLAQMCRESKTPSHERGVATLTSIGAGVQAMSPFYQGILCEQLALFKLVSSPPIPVIPQNAKWLGSYITADLAASLTCRPRSFARYMMDAAKRFSDIAGLGKHATRCALACWHVIRFRLARSDSFPLLVADTALFLAQRAVVENEPLTAAGYLAFALHACSPAVLATSSSGGTPRVPQSLQITMAKVLKDCVQRGVQRHGVTSNNSQHSSVGQQQQHVLIHSTLPLFSYSLVAVANDGFVQDAATASHIATQQQLQHQAALLAPTSSSSSSSSSSNTTAAAAAAAASVVVPSNTTVQQDFDVECDRLYDDAKDQYSGTSIHCPRNLEQYRALFPKPHTEKTGARILHHQKHHYDDLYLPQPPAKKKKAQEEDDGFGFPSSSNSSSSKTNEPEQHCHFYSTSQDEPLQVRVGLRSRFGCVLRKVRLLYVELRAADRGEEAGEDGDVEKKQQQQKQQQPSSSSAPESELLVGAGARRVPHSEIFESENVVEKIVVPGPSATAASHFSAPPHRSNTNPHLTFLIADDTAATVSFTLPCTFKQRGTFAVVGFRYELEIICQNSRTKEQDVTDFESNHGGGGGGSISGNNGGGGAAPVLHNILFPCLHLQHLAYHEGVHNIVVGSSADTVAAAALFAASSLSSSPSSLSSNSRGLERGDLTVGPPQPLHHALPMHCEEQLMLHAAQVFSSGIPATHPSYIYVHVRAPVPMVSVEFQPPLPSACRSGELFSTQLIIKNRSQHAAASADHVRVYLSECCGHLFAMDAGAGNPRKHQQRAEVQEKLQLSSAFDRRGGGGGGNTSSSNNKNKSGGGGGGHRRTVSKGASDLLADWIRIPAQDEHSQQNTGGIVRISIPHLKPGVTCTFNVLFRAQGNEFLRKNNMMMKMNSSGGNNNNSRPLSPPPAPDHDVASIALFACWTMPREYFTADPTTAPAISASMLRCGRFYRRMIVLPSISVHPKCLPLISTKPLRTVVAGEKTNNTNNSNNENTATLAPQAALSIEIRSEKKPARSVSSGAASSISTSAAAAAGSKADSFFIIDDISIVSAGWDIKRLTAPSAMTTSKQKKKDRKALLASRSVTSTTNWSCAALLTRQHEEEQKQQQQQDDDENDNTSGSGGGGGLSSSRWATSTLIPRIGIPPLDTSSSSSSNSSSSSSSPTSSDSDDDDDHNGSRPTFSRRRPLLPSKQSLLHFAVNAPVSGAGVFGRPPIIADGLAFFLDSSERAPNAPGSPTMMQSPSPAGGGVNDDGSFPTESPVDPFEKELLALPDEFSPNEDLPVLLRISWREVTSASSSGGGGTRSNNNNNNSSDTVDGSPSSPPASPPSSSSASSSSHVTLRRGVTFDVVHVAANDAAAAASSSSCDVLYRFRERLRAEFKFRRENDGRASPPHSPASPSVRADMANVKKLVQAGFSPAAVANNTFVLPSDMSRGDVARMVPRVMCALSAPQTRVCSTFSQSGFAAEVPINVAVSNLSPFPVLVSIYAVPRYAAAAGGVPVVFSGRHAFTDIMVRPSETITNLHFVALALSPGILDVASSCFSFEVVNALICGSTRSSRGRGGGGAGDMAQPKYLASSSQRNIVGTQPAAPFPSLSPLRQQQGGSQQQQHQQSGSSSLLHQQLPPASIVFGPVGGVAHSSLVRVEAMRQKPPQQQQHQQQLQASKSADELAAEEVNKAGRSILDLSFSSKAAVDAAESVAAAAAADAATAKDDISSNATSESAQPQQQQQPTTTLLRRRGERGASRVVRNADGTSFVPLRMELPASTTAAAAAAAGSSCSSSSQSVTPTAAAAETPTAVAPAMASEHAARRSYNNSATPTPAAGSPTERADSNAATPRHALPSPRQQPHQQQQPPPEQQQIAEQPPPPPPPPAMATTTTTTTTAAAVEVKAEESPAAVVADSDPSPIDVIAARVGGGRTTTTTVATEDSSSEDEKDSSSVVAKNQQQQQQQAKAPMTPSRSANNVFASSSDDDDGGDGAAATKKGAEKQKARLPSDLFESDKKTDDTAAAAAAEEKKAANLSFRKNRFATSSDDDDEK